MFFNTKSSKFQLIKLPNIWKLDQLNNLFLIQKNDNYKIIGDLVD